MAHGAGRDNHANHPLKRVPLPQRLIGQPAPSLRRKDGYINKQGGLRFAKLNTLELVQGYAQFQYLRATHVPGVMTLWADLLSRSSPLSQSENGIRK